MTDRTNAPTPDHANHGRTRREFLSTAAGVAAAASVIGAGRPARAGEFTMLTNVDAAAKPRIPVKDGEPVRIGIIGTGGMGTGHVNAVINLTKQGRCNAKIAALADPVADRLAHARGEVKKNQGDEVDIYRNHRDLLEKADVHAVLIASPEHWHADHAIDALFAGKDVYVEKPMTLDLPDAVRLYKAARANPQLMLQVGTQMMQLPKYQRARDVLDEGYLGVPTSFQTSYCRNSKTGEWNYYHINPDWRAGGNVDWDEWCGPMGSQPWDPKVLARWRRYRKFSTGIIGDLLVHQMTPLLMALDKTVGWPVHVVATGAHMVDKEMENHDQVNLTATFENGTTMTVAGSTCNEMGLENIIRCHKGNIYLNSRHCDIRPERIWSDDIDPETIECEDIGNDQDLHRVNWIKSIRSREQPLSGPELGTKIMVIVDLATRSIWEGKAFNFDPRTMTARAV